MVNQIALELQKILSGKFNVSGLTMKGGFRFGSRSSGEALVHRPACAKKPNANRSLGPSVCASDLLDLVTFQIVACEHHAIVLLAGFQNATDVDGRQIDLGRRR